MKVRFHKFRVREDRRFWSHALHERELAAARDLLDAIICLALTRRRSVGGPEPLQWIEAVFHVGAHPKVREHEVLAVLLDVTVALAPEIQRAFELLLVE